MLLLLLLLLASFSGGLHILNLLLQGIQSRINIFGCFRIRGVKRIASRTCKLLDGRYGPYVTDGETNASLPRSSTPEELSFDEALDLLAERKAKGGTKKKVAKKKATKKKATKKKTVKKKAVTKKGVKKKATKKSATKKSAKKK